MRTNSNPRIWTKILLCSLCAAFALFFLLKGEDSPYDFSTTAGLFRVRNVSVYTYYFVWPQSKRDSIGKIEDAYLPMYLWINGYSNYSLPDLEKLVLDPHVVWNKALPRTLTELMKRNIGIAASIGIITIVLSIVLFFPRGKKSSDD